MRAYQIHCGFISKQKHSSPRQSHILLWKKNVPGCHQQKRVLCSGLFFLPLCLFLPSSFPCRGIPQHSGCMRECGKASINVHGLFPLKWLFSTMQEMCSAIYQTISPQYVPQVLSMTIPNASAILRSLQGFCICFLHPLFTFIFIDFFKETHKNCLYRHICCLFIHCISAD